MNKLILIITLLCVVLTSCKTAVTKDDSGLSISLSATENNTFSTHNPENDPKIQCFIEELKKYDEAKGSRLTEAEIKSIAARCGLDANSFKFSDFSSPSEYEMLYAYPNPTSGNVTIGLGKNFSFNEIKDDTRIDLYYRGTKY